MQLGGIRGARALSVVVVALIVATGCTTAPPASDGSSAAATMESTHLHPVILVPGFEFDCTPRHGDWNKWVFAAQTRGFNVSDFIVMRPDPCTANVDTAASLGRLIDNVLAATGDTKVDIVAHSMGSLAVRWCIRFGSCAGKVDKFMGLAAANHGTIWANLCAVLFWSHSCGDMAPASTMLTDLNAEDESWGDTRYATITSWCDLTIVPFTSTALKGADNMVDPRCLTHTDWKMDDQTIDRTFAWFDASSTSGPERSPWT